MISEKLIKELNEQIKFEFFSANFYLAMAAYCDNEDLPGFANFFKVQAEEEKFHAMKFYEYIVERGGRVTIPALDGPGNEFSSMLDVFEKGLAHENFVTKRIYGLMDLATEEKEHATISFLKWFIDEQVEEEATFGALVKKLKRIEENSNAMYMLDTELAARVFTPPTNA
ncbi:ferritin [Anaeromicrobium sediminis]|uniref:Ferritin n=1 Tax=Anaeromicrobium sediminis TaxID=1478221 RepID=A0A267MD87_9FIRM|nr:ferritin [Anaeromicrobium sediminis]PAB57516.1 ferritin [Anaeromicrobium sediminis]